MHTHIHIQRQTSWDGRSSEAPVTVRESVCWRGPPDAPYGPCQLILAHSSSPGRDRQERPWMEKAGTAVRTGQGQSSLRAGQHRYCTVRRKNSLLYHSLVPGLPSYFYSLVALLVLPSPSGLILPSTSYNHATRSSFIVSGACSLTSGRARKAGGEADARREVFSGAVEAHINIISLLTCYHMMSVNVRMRVCVACVSVCMCVCD